jgi:single-strand DNA-binding protein
MPDLNKVYLIGNLTRDPELRYIPSGAAVCKFGMAVNRRYSTGRGEEREEVCFLDVEAWGKQGETVNNYLRKGSPALVEGRLQYDQWEDRETGRKRSRLLVHAERIQFLGSPARGAGVGDSDSGGGSGGDWDRGGGSGSAHSADSPMPPFEDLPAEGDDTPPDSVPF